MSNRGEDGNRNTPIHKLDTADFLAFSDNQPATEFCPTNSSSPQKHWKQTTRNNYQKNWNNRRSGGFRNNTYSNTSENPRNRSFNGPYENYQHKRFSSPNHSFSSGFNNSWRRSDSSYSSPKNTNESGINILSYLHPSFMEDPWAKLEEKLKQSRSFIDPEALNDSSDNTSEVQVEF